MIRRKYANMRIYEDNIDFADVENTITYSLSAKNLENNLNKREEELCNKISDLETKLAEKDAERELDNSFWKQECDSLQKALAEKEELKLRIKKLDKLYSEALETVDSLFTNQDKISFTIQQLEKVKEFCQNSDGFNKYGQSIRVESVVDFINCAIEDLKGKK